MYTYERTQLMQASPEECFDYLTDPANMPAWDPNVVESKSLTDGPVRVGTQLQQIRKQGNRTMTCQAEVIEHERPSRHSVRTNIMGIDAVFAYTFEPQDNGTRAKVVATLKGKGFTCLLEGFMGKMCEKVDDDILKRLAEALSKRQ